MKKICYISHLVLTLCFSAFCLADELLIVSPHWEGYKREFERDFVQWYRETEHRDVALRWIDVGGASDILKYILSRNSQGLPMGIDVVFGGGVDVFNELKGKGLLEKTLLPRTVLDPLPQTVQGNPVYDPDHYWFSVNLAGFGITYNKVVLQFLGAPEPSRWDDLANPLLRGWIGSADPRKSGSVRFIYELLLQYYGWEQGWRTIYGIASNVRTFSGSSSETPKDIAMGEIAAGMVIDSYGRDVVRSLGEKSVGLAIPQEIPSVFGDGAAILHDAPNRAVAQKFMIYALSERAQGLLIKHVGAPGGPKQYELGRFPVLPSLYQAASDRLHFPNPYTKGSSFRYDPVKAVARWRYVTSLLGSVAVDLQYELAQARYERGIDIHSLPPPVSEASLEAAIEARVPPAQLSLDSRAAFREILGVEQNTFWQKATLLLAAVLVGTILIKSYVSILYTLFREKSDGSGD